MSSPCAWGRRGYVYPCPGQYGVRLCLFQCGCLWQFSWFSNFKNFIRFEKFQKCVSGHSEQLWLFTPSTPAWTWSSVDLACYIFKPPSSHVLLFISTLLPPASEGWRKVMFSLCPPLRGGGGGGEGVPSSSWREGEVPPSQVQAGGVPPSQVGGVLPSEAGGVPTSQAGGGVLPSRVGGGVLPSQGGTQGGGGYPLPEQHNMYLLRGGRYAFCVHAGGLSYFISYFHPYQFSPMLEWFCLFPLFFDSTLPLTLGANGTKRGGSTTLVQCTKLRLSRCQFAIPKGLFTQRFSDRFCQRHLWSFNVMCEQLHRNALNPFLNGLKTHCVHSLNSNIRREDTS